ncbi:CP2 transcription factor-domain-containing protein [Gamsiella multidivaricata]|uniref:CP2 transcription factor-domain-containing protein n=1 Tax=Gamsiella multidivaricata TaxID=101098 RepID=UPI0022211BB2|nr:CP2 transcription factor-domain-containing protein [Gamsiella multidivaricata]KAI7825237.1 CP2 transcription factor-domain-containing protein [Gamsiella multidivaricata]
MNSPYQQPQYHLQQQQQQQQQQSRVLPSPSVSLNSDDYATQRDYNNGGEAPISVSSSTGQSQQEQQSEQASVSASGASESVEGSFSPQPEHESGLRFKVTLDAQTAAMQHQGDTPVTYLNKGQFYTVTLQDTEEYDGDICSVIKVTFHEEPHRKMAARYWSFWLSQQATPKTARALDIEKASSTGMTEVQSKTFDRISFKWNGKVGAKLMVRFNCLSTDFSRIKGVKGIPLRVHMDTILDGSTLDSGDQEQQLERSYAKIKLFRDKGAERKNKDDHKHLERMWDKMRGKNADTNPLSQVLAPVQSVSAFWECFDHQEDSAEDETLGLSETLAQESLDSDPSHSSVNALDVTGSASAPLTGTDENGGLSLSGDSNALAPASRKRRRPNDAGGGSGTTGISGALERSSQYGSNDEPGSSDQLLDKDPTYVPQMRKKKQPALCLYIKIGGEAVYRAVYLEKLTLSELIQKLSEKLEIQSSTISGVYRKTTKKELMVRVDDSMVAQMTDELDMVVEYDFNQQDGSVNLTLKY